MRNISHKIGVASDKTTTLKALNSLQGLAKWWTEDVSGSTNEGETILFRFNGQGPDMKVLTSNDDIVSWQCTSGPDEWLKTELTFQVKEEEETVIYFQHKGWQEETPFYYHCSMKWATFLLSLKRYLDLGKGKPFPDDLKITTIGF